MGIVYKLRDFSSSTDYSLAGSENKDTEKEKPGFSFSAPGLSSRVVVWFLRYNYLILGL